MICLIDIAFFAAAMTLFALVACYQARAYRAGRVDARCACGRAVKQLTMVSDLDVLHYAQRLTDECPRCTRMKAEG